jgi:hypothetical protein
MSTDPLPRGWTRRVRSSVLHAISLATAALTVARARAGSEGFRTELERAEHEIALLREELDLKDSRWIRLSPRRRPHYTPVQRMRILQLKAARNWSCEQAAEALMIDADSEILAPACGRGGGAHAGPADRAGEPLPGLRPVPGPAAESPLPDDGQGQNCSDPCEGGPAPQCDHSRSGNA